MSPESAQQRLRRLLTMVPWLMKRQGVSVTEVAGALGVSEDQVRKDLSLLFMCGLPGQGPGDLIEVSMEQDAVQIGNADEIARPLRLTPDEAMALMVGLRTVATLPGMADDDVLERTLAKLSAATQGLGDMADRVQVGSDDSVDADTMRTLREALDGNKRLNVRYHVPARDEITERDVDPIRLVNEFSTWYLDCWCHLAQDQRTLRVDRIMSATVLDADGTPPSGVRPRELTGLRYVPSEGDVTVELALAPEAAWVADYYPCERLSAPGEDPVRVRLQVGDTGWVPRLCWQFGGAVQVTSPSDLVDVVRDAGQSALAAYR